LNVAGQAALGVGSPLGYALAIGFDALKLKNITLEIGTVIAEARSRLPTSLRAPGAPGEDVEVTVTLSGENGVETAKKVRYRVPVGASPGILYFTASDATGPTFWSSGPRRQHIPPIQRGSAWAPEWLRTNTKAYLRVWRAEAAFTVEGPIYRILPHPRDDSYANATGSLTLSMAADRRSRKLNPRWRQTWSLATENVAGGGEE